MNKVGVVRFLGTNCDWDIYHALEKVGCTPSWLWYEEKFSPEDYDGVVVPGGFSYGDYLRAGALAARSPVMESVEELSKLGKPVLGICNGFQILCERGLLPGALLRNEKGRFIDRWVDLNPQTEEGFWGFNKQVSFPIAHGEGRYFASSSELQRLKDNGQVWLSYGANPNGSVDDIAGVLNESGNVAGLMPHPERAMEAWMGGDDGVGLLERFKS